MNNFELRPYAATRQEALAKLREYRAHKSTLNHWNNVFTMSKDKGYKEDSTVYQEHSLRIDWIAITQGTEDILDTNIQNLTQALNKEGDEVDTVLSLPSQKFKPREYNFKTQAEIEAKKQEIEENSDLPIQFKQHNYRELNSLLFSIQVNTRLPLGHISLIEIESSN